MTTIIRDTGTLVLIKWTVAYQEPIITTLWIFKLLTQSRNIVSQTFTKKDNLVFSTLLKICFRLQFTSTRVLTFQPFQLQLKNEHFLKVKVKCYSKNDSYWKVHIFYLMILMIDCKLDWSHSTQLVSNEHISITSIKCFSITREDINPNINMAVISLGTV